MKIGQLKRILSFSFSIESDYEEMMALHRAKEEAKQIEMSNERKKSLRQLFYEQAKLNRLKVKIFSWIRFS